MCDVKCCEQLILTMSAEDGLPGKKEILAWHAVIVRDSHIEQLKLERDLMCKQREVTRQENLALRTQIEQLKVRFEDSNRLVERLRNEIADKDNQLSQSVATPDA